MFLKKRNLNEKNGSSITNPNMPLKYNDEVADPTSNFYDTAYVSNARFSPVNIPNELELLSA